LIGVLSSALITYESCRYDGEEREDVGRDEERTVSREADVMM
jgi:hypothetical protein